jgi:hypothetical protein
MSRPDVVKYNTIFPGQSYQSEPKKQVGGGSSCEVQAKSRIAPSSWQKPVKKTFAFWRIGMDIRGLG